jgi:hypothetical protein
MAGCTRTHAAADGCYSIIQLAQVFHDLETGARLNFVLDSVAIYDSHQRHPAIVL